jgi:hypothetical protein
MTYTIDLANNADTLFHAILTFTNNLANKADTLFHAILTYTNDPANNADTLSHALLTYANDLANNVDTSATTSTSWTRIIPACCGTVTMTILLSSGFTGNWTTLRAPEK